MGVFGCGHGVPEVLQKKLAPMQPSRFERDSPAMRETVPRPALTLIGTLFVPLNFQGTQKGGAASSSLDNCSVHHLEKSIAVLVTTEGGKFSKITVVIF